MIRVSLDLELVEVDVGVEVTAVPVTSINSAFVRVNIAEKAVHSITAFCNM